MTVPTTDQILSGAVRMRRDDFRFDLLDATGATIGTLAADLGDPPVVSWDSSGRLPRTMSSLNLPAGFHDDIDVVSMQVRPVMVLQNGDEYPLGVFRWSDDNLEQRSWGDNRLTSLVDRSTMLDQQMTRAVGWKPPASPITAARNLAREVIPDEWLSVVDSAVVLSAPMSWSPGTSRLQIMTELCEVAGYLPPYFDRDGICQIRPTPDPTLDPDAILWPVGAPVRAGSRTRTNTLLDTPNVYVVYDSSGQGGGLRGVYQVPASAPHSVARRGYAVPLVEGISGLPSQAAANRMAYTLSLTDGRSWEYQTFDGAANPLHDGWSVVEFRGERWLETSWRLVCRNGGLHDHTLRRVYSEVDNG